MLFFIFNLVVNTYSCDIETFYSVNYFYILAVVNNTLQQRACCELWHYLGIIRLCFNSCSGCLFSQWLAFLNHDIKTALVGKGPNNSGW